MPTYQYACTECDHAFEQVQSFTEDSLTSCPQCEGRLRKIFNAVGVVFKGSGFYRTDNRSDAKSPSTGSKTGTSTESSSTSSDSSSTSSGSSAASTPVKAEAGAA
ncbi:MAG TPA: FmdB family zinc ribbon protein [Nocardioidaceae bacterium]|nr:FmdB family zinc ribbon protein [Nocardioidaceae bacterium]